MAADLPGPGQGAHGGGLTRNCVHPPPAGAHRFYTEGGGLREKAEGQQPLPRTLIIL